MVHRAAGATSWTPFAEQHRETVTLKRTITLLMQMMAGVVLAIGLSFMFLGGAHATERLQRVTVTISGCSDCTANPPGVTVWDETQHAEIVPLVDDRSKNGFTLTVPAGYYDVFIHSPKCHGDRYMGVLRGHNRTFEMKVRCDGVIRMVDTIRGLAGTIPATARTIWMRQAEGWGHVSEGVISQGAYYFDEVYCGECVLEVALRDGRKARVAAILKSAGNSTLVRHDISAEAVREGVAVHGSPFNAPETLVEGPQESIWVLDRLGNRVARIMSNGRCREFDLPTPFAGAGDIVGTEKSVWVSEQRVDKIVQFHIDGSHTEYRVEETQNDVNDLRITLGGDGRIWYIDYAHAGAIDESGRITDYTSPTPVFWLGDLVAGSDGRTWVTGLSHTDRPEPFIAAIDKIGTWSRFPLAENAESMRAVKGGFWLGEDYEGLSFIDLQGHQTSIKLPIGDMKPKLLAVDDTGALWFTDRYGNAIAHAGRDTAATAEYTAFGPPGISDMRFDGSGNLWIAEPRAHVIEEYEKGFALPPAGVNPKNLLFDSRGNLWYSDPVADVVGVIKKDGTSRCYAFRLSRVRRCSFDRVDRISEAAENVASSRN